uniref:Retrotransposon gag domain-containing protein n=1 Tax=Fagus sylvatica TaxID=28930 RepID=A0A2N9GYN3_FAGSY
MVGETNGPNEHEVRMAASEHKLDDLLAFVHMMVKRDTEMGNQKRKDGKSTNGEVSEGRPHINMDPLPRPPIPPKPEGKDSQLDMPPKFKVPKLEKNKGRDDPMIHLQMYCWKMAQYANNEPLMIQTFQGTLTGHTAEWYSQLKKTSHWKGLADTFLAQKYAQRWKEKVARARLPLDEKEIIMIFINTLKNPYFNRIVGLQLQFLVDLIPVEERIEDAVKTKEIMDMSALMALVEQIAKGTLVEKNEGEIQMIAKNDRKWRRTLPCCTHLESTKADSDSTTFQGAQDLNDPLGLLKGAIFEKSQQRNLRQLRYNEMMVLENMMPSLDRPRASQDVDHFPVKASHNCIQTLERSAWCRECHPRKTKHKEPSRFNQVPTNPPISMLKCMHPC